jgi:glycosidase
MFFIRTFLVTFAGFLLSLNCLAGNYKVERLEPPFWWQGFKHKELQLLVYGPAISELEPSIDYPGVSITRIKRSDNPNYLFVYLEISETARAGEFDIRFSNETDTISHRYTLLDKNPDPAHTKGFSSADTMYLITPDRFANGNIENDNEPGMGDLADRSKPNGRHGGDLEGVRQHLDYISDMGFTAIWLNPVLENRMEDSSYHGYSTTDFYRVDPRLGSNESYRELVIEGRQKGIGMIMDMIVNHVGSNHWWMSDLPAKDWINFPDQYTESSHEHDTVQDPYASDYDRTLFSDGWFVPTMPDLNQRNPLLGDYLVQNALWWVEYLGLAGIRLDTYAYPDKFYMAEWSRRIMEEYPNFNIVGEESNRNPVAVSYWQRGKQNYDGYVSYLPSLMDFALQEAMVKSLVAPKPPWGSSWEPLFRTLANDYLYADPNALVIFPDNHDMDRIYTQLNEDYDLFKMAMVYMVTMRGTPQFFYGAEILMSHTGTTADGIRRSDFPGGWPGDKKNAFNGEGLGTSQKQAQSFVRHLLNWRKNKPVIHSGKLMHFVPNNGMYAYVRFDGTDKVLVVLSKNEQPVVLDKTRYAEQLKGHNLAHDVLTGDSLDLSDPIEVPARGMLLLELE